MTLLTLDYTTLFYWLVVADNAKTLFITGIFIFTLISIVATVGFVEMLAQNNLKTKNKIKLYPEDGCGEVILS